MIKLYTADIREIKKADYIAEYNLLCSFQKQKTDAFLKDDDKKRSLAGLVLLRRGIYELFGKESYNISYNPNGKPLLDFCRFSIAHSGNMAVCAFSDTDIGADIEMLTEKRLSRPFRFFTENENRYVFSSQDQASAFFEVWTKKESYVKMKGLALSQNAGTDILNITDARFETTVQNGYMITVCVSSNRE